MSASLQSCVLPEPGHKLYVADYKQMELRVLAILAKDEVLNSALLNGTDLHREMASRVYGIPVDKVTREQRTAAKAVVFGAIYGQTPYGLAEVLNIPEVAAATLQEALWVALPMVRAFILRTQQEARRTYRSVSYHGRVRDLSDEYHRRSQAQQEYADRLAVNHKVQTTAGDLMRIGLINLTAALTPLGGWVILTRHDEILFSVPEQVPEQTVSHLAYQAMVVDNEPEFKLDITLKVGDRWDDSMRELNLASSLSKEEV